MASIEENKGPVKPLSRGEQTRQLILAAALQVIAKQGYRALTHRAIALEAGVSLSLTTYHFKDLEALLHDAFAQYKTGVLAAFEERWQVFYQSIVTRMPKGIDDPDARRPLVDALVDYLQSIVIDDVAVNKAGVAVEMTFHFDLHLQEVQRNFAYELCNSLQPQIADLFEQLGTESPEVDAYLLLDAVHFLRFRHLAVPTLLRAEDIRARLNRLLYALLVSK